MKVLRACEPASVHLSLQAMRCQVRDEVEDSNAEEIRVLITRSNKRT